jgi:serine/threonine-protein kinase
LCDLIASGGMAAVHLGRFIGVQEFSRIVAIKQLHDHYAGDRDFVAMLFDEARLLARIRHTNVVAPLDVELCGSELYIVMEYVHAESLSRVLRAAAAPVPPSIACAVMCQVLSGLHAAHEARGPRGQSLDIVHRDVSPQNILIMQDGTVKIVDFGIAKAGWRMHTTSCGTLKGKRSYMAPEQFRGQEVDRRTDIFSAGVVLWEMLTGKRLFTGDAPALVEEQVMSGNVPAPSQVVAGLPPELDSIVLKAMALEPSERFADAHTMAAALASTGPLANMLEVGAWVSKHVGEALHSRAARILELESVPLEELTLPLPSSGPNHDRPAAPIAFASSTVPTVRDKPEPRPRGRTLRIVSAVGLCAAAAVLVFAQRQEAKPALARATLPTARLSAARTPVTGPEAAQLAQPSQTAVHATVAAAPTLTQAASPANGTTSVVSPRKATPPRAPRVQAETPPVQAPPAAAAQEAPAAPETAAPSPAVQPAPQPVPDARCNPPFMVDSNGFKRFKLECVAAKQ